MSYGMSLYEEFIHLSRYSRWLESEHRRETWEETVERYFKFFEEHLKENYKYEMPSDLRKELKTAILERKVMPSMRALMTAGEALKRENVAGYNCSYVNVNKLRAFDEILYVLMNGTGVGFGVERDSVAKLPTIAEEFSESDTTIIVQDSKLGWAKAYRELVSLLVSGQIPRWDLSKVRPAGARLKTFGGRASGPQPLDDLFRFTVETFRRAAGRKLTSIECHDIVCKIAEIVVVGGVRRCLLDIYTVETVNRGRKQLKELEIGDKMMFNGEEITITNIFDNGIQDTVNINMEDGTFHTCTKEHRWYVFNHDTNQAEWRQTHELSEGNYSMLRPKEGNS